MRKAQIVCRGAFRGELWQWFICVVVAVVFSYILHYSHAVTPVWCCDLHCLGVQCSGDVTSRLSEGKGGKVEGGRYWLLE